MNEEIQKRHISMVVGNLGLILLGLAFMRVTLILDDRLTQGLLLFGFIFVGNYLSFTEKRAGVTDKEKKISVLLYIIVILLLMFLFFF